MLLFTSFTIFHLFSSMSPILVSCHDSYKGEYTFTSYFFSVYSNTITKNFYSFWFFLFRTSKCCRFRTFLFIFCMMLFQTFPIAYIYLTYHLNQLLLRILTPLIFFTGSSYLGKKNSARGGSLPIKRFKTR